jgi:D-glycero-D-manno-heptose 1,7-bisphosphate phosphatase
MTEFGPNRPTPLASRTVLAVPGAHRDSLREVRPAVFFDRDGTLIRDVRYIKNPDDVEFVPQAVNAIRRVNHALWNVVVVTNQSGIARGLLTEQDYANVRARVDDMVQELGAYITAHYHCPHHPDFSGPCSCRKPGTALFDQAMTEHAINPAQSLFVGDRWRDIEPARHYGARGISVPNEATPGDEVEKATKEMEVADTLNDAINRVLHV